MHECIMHDLPLVGDGRSNPTCCHHVHHFDGGAWVLSCASICCGAFVRDADAKKKCDVLHNIMHDFLHLRLILKEVDGAHCLTNAKIR